MIVRAFEKLVLLFRMLHHLVSPGEYRLAVAVKTWIPARNVVNSSYVSLEIA